MTYSTEVLADSPLVYLHADETTGTTLADASGNAHDFAFNGGTLNQATVMPAGTASVNFNGTSQNAQKAAATWMNQGQFTVEAWIKLASTSSFHAIASRDSNAPRGWTLYVDGGKLEFFDSAGVQHDSTATISAGTAYHVAVTVDNGGSGTTCTVKLYINGALDSTFTGCNVNGSPGVDMFLGVSRAGTAGSTFFTLAGNLDEFAYYGTVLSGTRLAAHYAAATGTTTVSGTAFGSLGGMSGSASGTRTRHGTAAGALGGVTGSASGVRTDRGTANGSLGSVVGTAISGGVFGTAAGSLGTISGLATGVRTDHGSAAGSLGPLTGNAAGVHVDVGTAAGSLGAVAGSAVGVIPAVILLPLLEFANFEVLAPTALVTPVLIGADHIQWGYNLFEGEAQDGGQP